MGHKAFIVSAFAAVLIALPASASERVDLRAGEHEGYARIALEWKEPVKFDTKIDGETLTIHFARPFTAQLNALAGKLDHYVVSAGQSADGTSIIAKLKKPVTIRSSTVNKNTVAIDLVVGDAAKKESEAKVAPALAAVAPAASGAPLVIIPPAGLDSAASAIIPPAKVATASSATDGSLAPIYTTDNDRPSLRFDLPTATGAAVFRRGAALWVVFGTEAKLDLASVRAAGQAVIRSIDQVPVENGTAVRLVVADGINPSVRRAGSSWIVDLKTQEGMPDTAIAIEARPAATEPEVQLHVGQAGAPLQLVDPVLGDRLTVVPVADLGRGIDTSRSFVDFRLLSSVQGIVLRPNSDGLYIHVASDGIDITRPGGLVLSDEHDRLLGHAGANQHRLFDFAAWGNTGSKEFPERRAVLDRAVSDAAPSVRTAPRVELAHFYFANFFGPETLSVLAQIEHDDPQSATDPAFHALKGSACLLAGADACAAQELGQASLDSESEIALWRGSMAAGKGDWQGAGREFLRGIGYLSSYPKPLRNRFALQAAEAMLESDRGSSAGPLIDMVLKDDPEHGEQAMALYLAGRREQQLGHLEPALELWVKVAAMGDRPSRARALYGRAMALYEAKKTNRLDTINALDALRFAWRGDIFEFTLLRRLGELNVAQGDVDAGLEALHEAAIYFPDYPASKEVAKQASDTFADMFIGKAADDMPPVKALSLYDEFHDLDPAGPRHDAIVQKLVDRLVAVDLLDRASVLLEDQVKNHLTGRDKTRAATQLVLLRLMNRQPDLAMTALDIDVTAGLTPDLTHQRQELKARAQFDLNRAPDALATLASDTSADADRLRADIYWRQQDWKSAAKVLTALAGSPPASGPLDGDGQRVVLGLAAALTLAGDQDGIARLRQNFGPAMTGTPSADSFKVVTDDGSTVTSTASATELATRIAQIGTLQNFMTAYKKRVASDKLSAIN